MAAELVQIIEPFAIAFFGPGPVCLFLLVLALLGWFFFKVIIVVVFGALCGLCGALLSLSLGPLSLGPLVAVSIISTISTWAPKDNGIVRYLETSGDVFRRLETSAM